MQQPAYAWLTTFKVPSDDVLPYSLTVETMSQFPVFLATVLEVLAHAVCPPVLSQWFLIDTARRISEATRFLFDFTLSPACSTTSVNRAHSLLKLVSAATLLNSLPSSLGGGLSDLVLRLVRYRLVQGPKAGWDEIDPVFAKILESSNIPSPSYTALDELLSLLQAEQWGEAGKDLRVTMQLCVPHSC